ncbi:hypothetical protein [Croceicoccus naphthovorans]|uniref:Uncharacterized protein n=1 Tax=Croceicoccus naphthovorans TaxID=1348774 RepID=A0A0G3XIG7_9SPHN|nr:hypothetical protein [Croceicoccus naphthovorans]AKM10128.1 hypothetical protein AB433_09315 [Croceicoccus naphthovorans]MBB3991583.1 hypothetical protein [Croceicoccus naphthovorans]
MFADTPPPSPRQRRYPTERIEAALRALSGGHGRVVIHREVPWASITFSGSRHTLSLTFSGAEAVEAGERMIADLPDHEFIIPGQLVADAQVLSVDHAMLPEPVLRAEVELLLLEDR